MTRSKALTIGLFLGSCVCGHSGLLLNAGEGNQPLLEDRPAAEIAQSRRQAAIRGNETVLLVEDESSVRRITAQNLRLLGYSVVEAANGLEALKQWDAHHRSIALLLADMVMPGGMAGLDLAHRLRETQPGLKVMIASGYSTEFVGQSVLAEERIVRLQKPCELGLLSETIRQCLDRKDRI